MWYVVSFLISEREVLGTQLVSDTQVPRAPKGKEGTRNRFVRVSNR